MLCKQLLTSLDYHNIDIDKEMDKFVSESNFEPQQVAEIKHNNNDNSNNNDNNSSSSSSNNNNNNDNNDNNNINNDNNSGDDSYDSDGIVFND